MSDNTEQLAKIVQRMDDAARLTLSTAKSLANELAIQRELQAQDRVQVARLLVLAQRIIETLDVTSGTADRLEATTHYVAEDLAASIARADGAPTSIPGAGADAALRSPGGTAAEAASVAANDVTGRLAAGTVGSGGSQ